MKRSPCRYSSGFTLVELMIAVLISTLVTGAVIYLLSGSNKSYRDLNQSAQMQEDAGFALHTLKQDLSLVGFFGGVRHYDVELDGDLGGVAGDCSGDAAAYAINTYLTAIQSDSSGNAFTCVKDALPETTVLVVKHTGTMPVELPLDLEQKKKTWILSNHEIGVLFSGADNSPPTDVIGAGSAWEYRAHVYYLQDNSKDIPGEDIPPSLTRLTLRSNGGSMSMVKDDLVSGVEEMRLQFGVDTNSDGNLDTFLDAEAINASPAYDWADVVAVQINLLVRTDEEDHAYTDNKTYNLGSGDPVVNPGDNYHRTVISTTVALRNGQFIVRDDT